MCTHVSCFASIKGHNHSKIGIILLRFDQLTVHGHRIILKSKIYIQINLYLNKKSKPLQQSLWAFSFSGWRG